MVEAGDLDLDAALANLPVRRLGTSDEIASTVLWLCSPGSSFVTGVALPVDGGFHSTVTHPAQAVQVKHHRGMSLPGVGGTSERGNSRAPHHPGERSQGEQHG
jgi:hypothetical protein